MKKYVSLLVMLVLVISMTACNNKEPIDDSEITVIVEDVESSTEAEDLEKVDSEAEDTEKVDSEAETKIKEGSSVEPESDTKSSISEEVLSTEQETIEEKAVEEKAPTCKSVDKVMYSNTTLNVRKGPDTTFDKIGSLSYAQEIKVTGEMDNDWYRIDYKDEVGYVSGKYVVDEKPEIVDTSIFPISYSDATANITITREWFENAWCYAAHLVFSDYDRLGTTCGNGVYGGLETTSSAATRVGAMFAVNGCYSAPNLNHAVARDGVVMNDRTCWSPAVYNSANGLLLSAWETNGTPGIAGQSLSTLVESGKVTDTFCFGPPILTNGVAGNGDGGRAQRTFMGTNGAPGDIWIVVSDGRKNDSESSGLTYNQCARYLQSKGCTFGIPLDGGGSSTMVWNGKVLNANKNQRAVVDFVYFK